MTMGQRLHSSGFAKALFAAFGAVVLALPAALSATFWASPALPKAAALAAQPAPVAPTASDPPPQGDSLGADWREQQNEARDTVREGRHLPLEQVIAIIRKRTPGRLLDTGLERDASGHPVYRVRWAAASGRRIDFLVDARSGAIVSSEGR